MSLPPVVSRDEWLAARKDLLAQEKESTRLRDAINAQRRRLPMVRIEKDYVFESRDGKATLLDLFEGRSQLYVHHFMWRDDMDAGCPSCTAAADMSFTPAILAQLHEHDVSLAAIARAPLAKLLRHSEGRDWSFPFYSSYGTTFNHDFHVTLDDSVTPVEYNFRDKAELSEKGLGDDMLKGDWPGNSIFLRDGDSVFHTYSAYARGLDQLALPYNFLDLTPYGRQEDWEDSPAGWPQRPTYG
jgi:predicted dithiol-disulfide oxidoreductase (DUF899 family)